MNPKSEIEIEYIRAILDEQVSVSVRTAQDRGCSLFRDAGLKDRIFPNWRRRETRQTPREILDARIEIFFHLRGLLFRDRAEPDNIARLELSYLPQLGLHNRRRTHKATEAGAIRTENHGHVPGEIDGTDGVGVVMNIGGMKPRFTTVLTRPDWLRTDQANSRTV